MKSIKILFFALITIGWTACDDDPVDTQVGEGTIEIALRAQYDGDPLVMLQEYQYPDGKNMVFSRISFYMSNLKLTSEDGVASSSAVNYLMLNEAHTSLTDATEGYKFSLTGVQSDDYNKLSFDIGVPADLNAMTPTDFTSDNDLSLSGEYWPGWESYIFCKVEGLIDFDEDGTPESDFALHLGADPALVNINLNRNISVDKNKTTEVIIPIEISNLFGSGSTMYDIETYPKIHSLNQQPQVLELAANLETCF